MFAYQIKDKKITLTIEIPAIQSNDYAQQGYVISDTLYVVANSEYDGTKWIDTTPTPAATPVYVAPVPTAAEIAAQREATLNNLNAAKQSALALEYTKANMAGNTDYAGVIGNDFVSLQSVYGNYSEQIIAGNDPFALYGNDAFMLSGNGVFY